MLHKLFSVVKGRQSRIIYSLKHTHTNSRRIKSHSRRWGIRGRWRHSFAGVNRIVGTILSICTFYLIQRTDIYGLNVTIAVGGTHLFKPKHNNNWMTEWQKYFCFAENGRIFVRQMDVFSQPAFPWHTAKHTTMNNIDRICVRNCTQKGRQVGILTRYIACKLFILFSNFRQQRKISEN